MFGLFYSFLNLIMYGGAKVKQEYDDTCARENAKNNRQRTYWTANGGDRLTENGRLVWNKRNAKGEDVIADLYTGEVYYNLSKEKKQKANEEARLKGKTVRFKMEDEKRIGYYGKYEQPFHLVDIESGIPVREISVNLFRFYIRLSDGKVLRLTDDSPTEKKIGHWDSNELIDIMNKRQDEMRQYIESNSPGSFWIRWNFFLDGYQVYVDKNKNVNVYSVLDWKYIKNDCNE